MPDAQDRTIREHYDSCDEKERLLQSAKGQLEAERTRELLSRYLPPPPATVLDVGGASGVHALPLAREGYRVHLIDPVPRHVEQANEASASQPKHPLASAKVGDARRLEFDDGSADAVLMLGPLYHLTERADRIRALDEARRVLRPGGRLLAAAISRFASTLDGLCRSLFDDPRFVSIVERDLTDGQHRNETGDPAYFTTAFFHHPDELRDEVVEAGFVPNALLAVEGPAWLLGDLDRRWPEETGKKQLLDAVRRIEAEPSLLGASAHLMAIATRPGD